VNPPKVIFLPDLITFPVYHQLHPNLHELTKMKSYEEYAKKWSDVAKKHLLGKKIVLIRSMTKEEKEGFDWYNRYVPIMQTDAGDLIIFSADDEGNCGGAFCSNDDDTIVNQKIVDIKYHENEDFLKSPVELIFENENSVIPWSDPEGNDGGSLYIQLNNEPDLVIIPTIKKRRKILKTGFKKKVDPMSAFQQLLNMCSTPVGSSSKTHFSAKDPITGNPHFVFAVCSDTNRMGATHFRIGTIPANKNHIVWSKPKKMTNITTHNTTFGTTHGHPYVHHNTDNGVFVQFLKEYHPNDEITSLTEGIKNLKMTEEPAMLTKQTTTCLIKPIDAAECAAIDPNIDYFGTRQPTTAESLTQLSFSFKKKNHCSELQIVTDDQQRLSMYSMGIPQKLNARNCNTWNIATQGTEYKLQTQMTSKLSRNLYNGSDIECIVLKKYKGKLSKEMESHLISMFAGLKDEYKTIPEWMNLVEQSLCRHDET